MRLNGFVAQIIICGQNDTPHQKLLQTAATLTYEPANSHAVDMHAHPSGLAVYTLFLSCCSYLVIDMQLSSKDTYRCGYGCPEKLNNII